MKIRKSVRALVLNDQKIFLMQLQGGPSQPANVSFWCTLGGKIEADESDRQALQRELKEEAGITAVKKIEYLAFGEQILNWYGEPIRSLEKFYAVNVEADAINLKNRSLSQAESSYIKGYAWWSIAELINTKQIVFPHCLGHLMRDYFNSIQWEPLQIDLS